MAESLYDLELEAQAQALARRREALKQRAIMAARKIGVYAPPEAPGAPASVASAVTGAPILGPQVKGSALAAFTPAIAALADQYSEDRLTRDESAYQRRENEDAMRLMQSVPQARTVYGAGDEGPTMETAEPTLRQQLEFAARLAANPQTKALGGKLAEEHLVNMPGKDATRMLDILKLKETGRHNRAMESKPATQNFIPIVNDAGAYTGSFDTRNNVFFTADGRPSAKAPPGTPRPDQATATLPTAQPGGNAGPATVPGVQGKSSDAYQKTKGDADKTVINSNKALAVLADMPQLFVKANTSGFDQALESGKTFFTGKSSPGQDALDALGLKGAQLSRFADRSMYGPQFTNADVEAIEKSVGNFKAAKSITARITAYNELTDTFRRGAGLPPLGDEEKLTVEKLTGTTQTPPADTRPRISDENRAKLGDIEAAKRELDAANRRLAVNPRDPKLIQARDLLWADHQRLVSGRTDAPLPKRVLKWNPQTNRAE